MRRLLVPASAVCVALIAAACGGSSKHASTRTTTRPTYTVALTATAETRTTPPRPSPAQIARAVRLTATEPGFEARVDADIRVPQLGGNSVHAVGRGRFDPGSGSGTLDLAVQLPGLLSLTGPLPTEVRLVGGEAYVQVPADIASQLSTSDAWLQDSISALGLGQALSPPDILRELARDATRIVPGQRAHVTIDPRTGLVQTIVLSYAAAGGYHIHARLTLTGFGTQPATVAPPSAQTGDLQTALAALGF